MWTPYRNSNIWKNGIVIRDLEIEVKRKLGEGKKES